QAGQAASDNLNQAVIALREAAKSCQSGGQNEGQGGQGQSARQKIAGLSNSQSEVNQETESVAERLSRQERLAGADQETLERLAAQQRMIRKGIEEALSGQKPDDRLLGRLGQARDDMKEVERDLSAHRLDDETLARQQ